jgi:hypothetical protein
MTAHRAVMIAQVMAARFSCPVAADVVHLVTG